ncbi:hypothetical protein BN1708_003741 [Verticillium longisporum]|uniref:Uncharacterized protein n=1 Tax=Verticillium longisporum TaxID=100787 RepID=A0A0G4LQQ6_VERLO|nr:hypothetical protein BN1708_003741 [Verticillium longisporum]
MAEPTNTPFPPSTPNPASTPRAASPASPSDFRSPTTTRPLSDTKPVVLHIGDPIRYNPETYRQFEAQCDIIRPSAAERQRDAFKRALLERRWDDPRPSMDPNHMLPRPGERQRPSSKQNRFDPTRDLSSPPSYAPPSYQNHPQSRAELLPPILPPAAVHHDPASNKLPSLSSLTGPPPPSRNPPPIPTSRPSTSTSISSSATTKTAPASQEPAAPAITHWPSMNPFTTYYTPSHVQQAVQSPAKMDVDTTSSAGNSHTGTSPDRLYDARSVSVSLDDPEVRLAAEALGDLRADFVNSPPSRSTPLPTGSPALSLAARSSTNTQSPQQEPLFSLLTTSHPLLATTIEGATSAYNNSKNFSPRFKTSAEYVEGYLTPIANTVGSVGRVTGVEGGVRWFLGEGRRPSDLEAGQGSSNKRRKVRGDDMVGVVVDPAAHILAAAAVAEQESNRDSYLFKHDRRLSRASTIDTLPAYDEVLVLAKEGLDMITQVSGVIDGTIVSAEEWCDRLGSKRKDEGSVLPEAHVPVGDVKAA